MLHIHDVEDMTQKCNVDRKDKEVSFYFILEVGGSYISSTSIMRTSFIRNHIWNIFFVDVYARSNTPPVINQSTTQDRTVKERELSFTFIASEILRKGLADFNPGLTTCRVFVGVARGLFRLPRQCIKRKASFRDPWWVQLLHFVLAIRFDVVSKFWSCSQTPNVGWLSAFVGGWRIRGWRSWWELEWRRPPTPSIGSSSYAPIAPLFHLRWLCDWRELSFYELFLWSSFLNPCFIRVPEAYPDLWFPGRHLL